MSGAPTPTTAEGWEEEFRSAPSAEERTSTDDLLDALSTALRMLQSGSGDVDRQRALSDSFSRARHGLDEMKALLLYVTSQDPLQLRILYSSGLGPEQLEACRELRSGEGVSPSVIRHAIETREAIYIPNAQMHASAQATASLSGASHSVLCAPILDPLTSAVLAVIYFQMYRPFQHGTTSG